MGNCCYYKFGGKMTQKTGDSAFFSPHECIEYTTYFLLVKKNVHVESALLLSCYLEKSACLRMEDDKARRKLEAEVTWCIDHLRSRLQDKNKV